MVAKSQVQRWTDVQERRKSLPQVWIIENTEDGIVYGVYDSQESAQLEFDYRKRSGERRISLRSYAVQDREQAVLVGWVK